MIVNENSHSLQNSHQPGRNLQLQKRNETQGEKWWIVKRKATITHYFAEK